MKKTSFLPWLVLTGCVVLASVTIGRADSLQTYAQTPGAIASQAYSVTVNGSPVFVEKFKDVNYARFAFDGTAKITVTANEPVKSFQVSPMSCRISATNSGRELSFLDRKSPR